MQRYTGTLTDLPELAVGNQQSTKGLEAIQGPVGILLAILLGDGHVGGIDVNSSDLLGLPDEVLKKLAVVLGQKHLLGLLNHIAKVLHEDLALVRQL